MVEAATVAMGERGRQWRSFSLSERIYRPAGQFKGGEIRVR
jgi:hypothetical protein